MQIDLPVSRLVLEKDYIPENDNEVKMENEVSNHHLPTEKENYSSKSFFEKLKKSPDSIEFGRAILLIKSMKKAKCSIPFRKPVDPISLKVPTYNEIVLEPVDLGTIEENIYKKVYQHDSEIHRDIYKMLMSSYKFNPSNSDVRATTEEL